MRLPRHRSYLSATSLLQRSIYRFYTSARLSHTIPYLTRMPTSHATPETLPAFLSATTHPYTPLPDPLTPSTATTWTPPTTPGADDHKGRYLWTDAFGVITLITASRLVDPVYLILATRLATTVHDILGRTRDGSDRLPGATDQHPLAGGLRIGKTAEGSSDGDGVYHHYITLWMFALRQLGIATGEKTWVERAVGLGTVTNKLFIKNGRMVWKVGIDGQTLVGSEGHLDAATGFVVYRLVAGTAANFGMGNVLGPEIEEYRGLMSRPGKVSASRDMLDLGMGLWMAHFFRTEEWAGWLGSESIAAANGVLRGVMGRNAAIRLAFREFGTCLGLECWGQGVDEELHD